MDKTAKWITSDFSSALKNAVLSNADNNSIQIKSDRVLFNGFWRGGDSQNVCLWLDKATWHDAKTGDGGGCKDFAKVAFNMSLPEFMQRFGTITAQINVPISRKDAFDGPQKLTKAVDEIWLGLQKNDLNRPDLAADWLRNKRGFASPRQLIGSGFTNLGMEDLKLFEPQHHKLIQKRLLIGPQIIAPLRGVHSEQVKNLFFRSIADCPKEEKSRLLTGAGGWKDPDGSPRAFGFPYLIHDFPNLVLCEGMADYFAAECLLEGEEKYLPLGASNAAALATWAEWIVKSQYKGRVTWVYQLDTDQQGKIDASGPGQNSAIQAHKILSTANMPSKLFAWAVFLKDVPKIKQIPNDLAQVFSITHYDNSILGPIFLKTLMGKNKK